MSLNNLNQLEMCFQESGYTVVHLKSFTKYVRQFYQQKHINNTYLRLFSHLFRVQCLHGYWVNQQAHRITVFFGLLHRPVF
jgi:hypothetical protein